MRVVIASRDYSPLQPSEAGFYPKCVISVIRLLETSAAPLTLQMYPT